ncbi:MAG: hypothetical protein UT84_C0009G0009 [Candidatus Curtissbacteria bacterium GW2011_GWA1_40_16]|uniref:Glycosyltransferase 2-like domain-containing protein n=1 Tax=Candidatus Curtissbacteria bacterium GW2011_GWA1_40_16 TaxID=1618405 RepID=A0A0G0UK61_9BACT|nr:MAG: hypothetical protein UT84_C0009G0009 [Candidatus Curtissbacteria bacterium GW2011_GWA1_40_16]
MSKEIDLSIVIVNYNTYDDVISCLQSIYKNSKSVNLEVIVIDNASQDGSQKAIRKNFPQVKLISNRTNLFFSKANNQGLKIAKGRYLLILAPDTKILPNTLLKMINFMDAHPTCALSTIKQIDQNHAVHLTCHKHHTPITEILKMPLWHKFFIDSLILKSFRYANWNRNSLKCTDTVPGAFMWVRREIAQKLEFLDGNFDIFYSDADFCKRISDLGWEIIYNGNYSIIHLRARSISKIAPFKLMQIAHHDLNHYAKKHFGQIWSTIIYILGNINIGILNIVFTFKKLIPVK